MNFGQMMKQFQKLQEDMERVQNELAAKTVTGTAGGGVVQVVCTGKLEVREVLLDPAAIDPDEKEMLQDLVTAAVNDALRRAQALAEEDMAKVAGGLNLPNIPGLPFG